MNRKLILIISFALLGVVGVGGYLYYLSIYDQDALLNIINPVKHKPTEGFDPKFTNKVIFSSLNHVWDIQFDTEKNIYISERDRGISVIRGDKKTLLHKPNDLFVQGEGGMLGITLDPYFSANNYLYACFNAVNDGTRDVRVARFKVNLSALKLDERTDIITGMPVNSRGQAGRHSGCRPRFGSDGYLWIGTGDAAMGGVAQDPKSLGGKVLRVDRDGRPAFGNLPEPFDNRIYSFGHRNIQGLAFFSKPKGKVLGFSDEHGPDTDDEVNFLVSGNFGWDPGAPYDEAVPMTDLKKFPDAVSAVWSSGKPTIATSGSAIIEGEKWGVLDGALAVANLKGSHLRVFTFTDDFKVKKEITLLTEYGRLRSITLGPDDDLYIGTSNGLGQDKIIQLTPHK